MCACVEQLFQIEQIQEEDMSEKVSMTLSYMELLISLKCVQCALISHTLYVAFLNLGVLIKMLFYLQFLVVLRVLAKIYKGV